MIVIFDIDGTLIDDLTQIIPISTINALEKLKKNGHVAVVNTGRPFSHIDPRIRALPIDGWICGLGTEIIVNNHTIYRNVPNQEICNYVIDSYKECGMQVLLESNSMMIYDRQYSIHPICLRELNRCIDIGVPIVRVDEIQSPRFTKFVSFDWQNCKRELFLQKMNIYFTSILRDATMIEYVIKECSKASGIKILADYFGVAVEDIIAVGDSANDLSMFRVVGHSVCMGQAQEEIKKQCEYVTQSVLDNGIEKALEHFGLI